MVTAILMAVSAVVGLAASGAGLAISIHEGRRVSEEYYKKGVRDSQAAEARANAQIAEAEQRSFNFAVQAESRSTEMSLDLTARSMTQDSPYGVFNSSGKRVREESYEKNKKRLTR